MTDVAMSARLGAFCLVGILCIADPGAAANSETPTATADFGGPDAVENQIADDAQSVPALIEGPVLQPWFDWKASLQERTGFSFGLDYIGLYLGAGYAGAEKQSNSHKSDNDQPPKTNDVLSESTHLALLFSPWRSSAIPLIPSRNNVAMASA